MRIQRKSLRTTRWDACRLEPCSRASTIIHVMASWQGRLMITAIYKNERRLDMITLTQASSHYSPLLHLASDRRKTRTWLCSSAWQGMWHSREVITSVSSPARNTFHNIALALHQRGEHQARAKETRNRSSRNFSSVPHMTTTPQHNHEEPTIPPYPSSSATLLCYIATNRLFYSNKLIAQGKHWYPSLSTVHG